MSNSTTSNSTTHADRTRRTRRRYGRQRRGATAVEMAMTLPMLFLILFGCYEFARGNMMKHATEAAAYEGARVGILPGATVAEVREAAQFVLGTIGVRDFDVAVDPDPIQQSSRSVRVTVTLRMRDNTSLFLLFTEDAAFEGVCQLSREGF